MPTRGRGRGHIARSGSGSDALRDGEAFGEIGLGRRPLAGGQGDLPPQRVCPRDVLLRSGRPRPLERALDLDQRVAGASERDQDLGEMRGDVDRPAPAMGPEAGLLPPLPLERRAGLEDLFREVPRRVAGEPALVVGRGRRSVRWGGGRRRGRCGRRQAVAALEAEFGRRGQLRSELWARCRELPAALETELGAVGILVPAPGADHELRSRRPSARAWSSTARTAMPLSRASRRTSSNSGVTVTTRPSRRDTLNASGPSDVSIVTISRGNRWRWYDVHRTPMVVDSVKHARVRAATLSGGQRAVTTTPGRLFF